jgi:hypothetical protein
MIEHLPLIKVCSLLTRCRQVLGWSAKSMEKHLRKARNYKKALAAQHQREGVEQQYLEFIYPGHFQDAIP